MNKTDWKETDKRFVAFFDIMGFKDLVQRNSHDTIVGKLKALKGTLKELEELTGAEFPEQYNVSQYQTRSITFSDSIVFFSKKDGFNDAIKILTDSYLLVKHSIANGVPIKGAISYGEITVDFENSLFFGQPIIDSYLLQDEVQLYTTIIDHNFEVKLSSFEDQWFAERFVSNYKTNLKTGKVMHKLLHPDNKSEGATERIEEQIFNVSQLYNSVSGKPRAYVDNTIDFLNSLLPKEPESTSTHPKP